MSNPSEMLGFAEAMLTHFGEHTNADVYRRAVTNRMYYSAFHAARVFHENLASPGSVGNANGSHEQLVSQLDFPTVSDSTQRLLSKTLSKSLRLILANRVKADYRLNEQLLTTDLNETVQHTRLIFSKTQT